MNESDRDPERPPDSPLPVVPGRVTVNRGGSPSPDASSRRRDVTVVALLTAALAVVGVVLVVAGAIRLPDESVSDPGMAGQAATPARASDGTQAYTVSELLTARAAGTVSAGPIALTGYWSDPLIAHSCAAPTSTPGELEIYCHDHEYGITELDEPFVVVTPDGRPTFATGPSLTPWLPPDLRETLTLAPVDGRPFPPVPIEVVGHFDDPRAADCRPEARQLCEDRFVLDEVTSFDVASVDLGRPSPSPSPFPFDSPPPGKWAAERCQPSGTDGPVELSYIGWMRGEELTLASRLDLTGEAVWVAIARDVVPLGDWYTLPGESVASRPMGRLVCFAYEWQLPDIIAFDALAGTSYRLYPDGTRVPSSP